MKKIDNPMTMVKLDKIVLHISVGNDWNRLQGASKLLESLTQRKIITKNAKTTIKNFNISRNSPTSCMVTLRKKEAIDMLSNSFKAVGDKLKLSSFDNQGNFGFGISEHLDLPGVDYDPDIGIFGMDVIVALKRPGWRIKKRKYLRSKLPRKLIISPEEAASFIKNEFNIEVI